MSPLNDVLILGGGLCGLAAAHRLGDKATVLERDSTPGGLVRSCKVGDYWFDLVIHLLHFPDKKIENTIREIVGEVLQPCPPIAWVDSAAGIARFPIQNHLFQLDPIVAQQCIDDLILESERSEDAVPTDYEQMLLRSFGRCFCNLFFFPYNRKMWKRPLAALAPTGFQWNIARPDIEQIKHGMQNAPNAYNANGWYPRPKKSAPLRGMEVLSQSLATGCADLRLSHTVKSVDLDRREVVMETSSGIKTLQFGASVVSTLPLPQMINMCEQAPASLKKACAELLFNRVRSVALCIEGPRPLDAGHWRYYTDETLLFTRLVFMNEFDPAMSPAEGWSLLVETTEPAELPGQSDHELIKHVWGDVDRCGILPEGSSLKDARVLLAEPGYVVFTPEMQSIVHSAREFLLGHGITLLGRYGHWEYSSMAQVMTDGFDWADNWLAG